MQEFGHNQMESVAIVAERISTRLWRIYSHNVRAYVDVRTYMSVTLRNVNLHSFALTCKELMCHMHDDGGACKRGTGSRLEDREERHFLTVENGVDSAAGPPQRTCFVESSAERSRQLATLRNRMQCTKKSQVQEGKREQEKLQRKKARCGESSQARCKLCSL